MEQKTFLETLRAMRPKDYIYPGIFLLFILVVVVIFFIVASSLSQHINKVISGAPETSSQGLNIEHYKTVAKKLNISVATDETNTGVNENSQEIPPPTATTTPQTLDKKSITLTVVNSTTKSGLASALAKKLQGAGFATPKTITDNKKPLATTTLTVKASKEAYTSSILEVVRALYPSAIATTTTENSPSDAIVTIGLH